jgi:hypothetical protein
MMTMPETISEREARYTFGVISPLLGIGLACMASILMISIAGCSGNAAGSNQVTHPVAKTATEFGIRLGMSTEEVDAIVGYPVVIAQVHTSAREEMMPDGKVQWMPGPTLAIAYCPVPTNRHETEIRVEFRDQKVIAWTQRDVGVVTHSARRRAYIDGHPELTRQQKASVLTDGIFLSMSEWDVMACWGPPQGRILLGTPRRSLRWTYGKRLDGNDWVDRYVDFDSHAKVIHWQK